MPTSWYQAIPCILDQIAAEKPQSILDIGVGFGKYGMLIRDVTDIPHERYHKEQWQTRIDGVEAFEEYRNPLHDYVYDKVYYGDIAGIIDDLPVYDCILFIDVLEHFEKADGRRLIDKLLAHAKKSLIVSTPLYPAKQEDYLGNKFERHASRWSLTDFLAWDFSYKQLDIGGNGAQLFHIFPRENTAACTAAATRAPRTAGRRTAPLKIGYILPHRHLTGGLKMLLAQMEHLRRRKHEVYAVLRGNAGETVLPDWYNLEVDKTILVPTGQSYNQYVKGCDVLVAGWFDQLAELSEGKVPVVYWEQGHEALFGDTHDLYRHSAIRRTMSHNYTAAVRLAAVSSTIRDILHARFARDAVVIPNFIDTGNYYPAEHPFAGNILLVGNPALGFKGSLVALKVLKTVWQQGHRFQVNWVSQVPSRVSNIPFPINHIVLPSQQVLAECYRKADLHLFTSWFEGFGLPPLEAMASGLPVVTTDCGGTRDYVRPGENALVADPGDVESLTAGLIYLLRHEQARQQLRERGLETAAKFSVANAIDKLEELLAEAAGR